MGEFRSEGRGRGYSGNRSGGGRSGGFGGGGYGGGSRFGGGGGGRFGRDERRPLEMHEVTCSKCKKQCEVPFKPTGDKPVYCSECFKEEGGSSRGGRDGGSSGISPAQFVELNKKLDKILAILDMIEFEEVAEEGEDESEEEVDEEEKPKKKK